MDEARSFRLPPPAPVSVVAALRRAVFYVVLVVLGVISVFPLLWMIVASLKPESEILNVLSLPGSPQLGNYQVAFSTVLPYLTNSVKLVVLNVVFLLIVASMAGFGFARLQFHGRDIAFAVLLGTAMVPGIVYLIPQYILYHQIGWIDTQYPLWVPRVLTPVFGSFLMRQAFKTLPVELEEAARMDGASTFTVFWRIMLPQVKPALAAVGALTFLESWNDLFGPLVFINTPQLQTLPVALALFQGEYFTQTNVLMASATLSVAPAILMVVLAQRYFVQGIATSGIRG